MEIQGRRRSSNFEDRGRGGGGGGGGGGLPVQTLMSIARRLGVKGTLVVGVLGVIAYFVLPSSVTQQLLGVQGGAPGASGGGSVCEASPSNGKACDFSRVVLASTEDVWTAQ